MKYAKCHLQQFFSKNYVAIILQQKISPTIILQRKNSPAIILQQFFSRKAQVSAFCVLKRITNLLWALWQRTSSMEFAPSSKEQQQPASQVAAHIQEDGLQAAAWVVVV